MSLYRVEVWTRQGEMLADISQEITQRQFTATRNRAEAITLTLDLYAAEQRAIKSHIDFDELFREGSNELRVYRGDRPLMGGTIYYVAPSIESNRATLDVRATGFLDLLKDRYVWPDASNFGRTYTNQDVGAVMWDFINYTQSPITNWSLSNGDFGIRQGAIQTSRTLTDTWQPWATSIRDILIAITERINSVDMEFTYDKHFNIYYPGIGTDKTELLFTYPGNIKRFALPKDATHLANTVVSRGSGNGYDRQVVSVRQDTDMQIGVARRESIIDNPSVTVNQTLQDFADEEIRLNSASSKVPDIVLDGRKDPALGAYWIGDVVRFSVPQRSSFAVLNGQKWKINQITSNPDAEDGEEIILKVGLS
jgi:hypothetical protein